MRAALILTGVLGSLALFTATNLDAPEPVVVRFFPRHVVAAGAPRFVVEYDADIRPARVLAKTRVSVGGKDVRLELIDQSALDPALRHLTDLSAPRRWIAFRTSDSIPPDTAVHVKVPGAELDLRSSPAFKVQRMECAAGHGRIHGCPPNDPFFISFTTPVEPDKGAFVIDPPIEDLELFASQDGRGNTIAIRGKIRPMTTYRVRIAASLRDRRGQPLGHPWEGTIAVGRGIMTETVPDSPLVVLGPEMPAALPIFSVARLDELPIVLQSVGPEEWTAFRRSLVEWQAGTGGTPPGKIVDERVYARRLQDPDAVIQTDVDLSRGFGTGRNDVIVRSISDFRPVWVSRSSFDVVAIKGPERLVVRVSSLRDGSAVRGAAVRLHPGGAVATSDANGLASLALPDSSNGDQVLIVTLGGNSAFVPETPPPWHDMTYSPYLRDTQGYWRKENAPASVARLFLFDDGATPRPGGMFRARGWIRAKACNGSGCGLATPPISRIESSLRCGASLIEPKSVAAVDSRGAFDLSIRLPEASTVCVLSMNAPDTKPPSHFEARVLDLTTAGLASIAAPAEELPRVIPPANRNLPTSLRIGAAAFSEQSFPSTMRQDAAAG